MRLSAFVKGLLFAAAAGLLSLPATLAAVAIVGRAWALPTAALALVVAYLVTLAPGGRRAFRVAVLATILGAALLWLAPSPSSALLGAAMLLAVMRSGFLYRARPARALAVEVVLLIGGYLVARSLMGPGASSLGLATWSFFLVQSVFFALGGIESRREAKTAGDRFETACQKVESLMETMS